MGRSIRRQRMRRKAVLNCGRVETVQPFDWYGGCLVFTLEDLDRVTLRDADGDGRPDVLLRLVGSPGSFNGACGWDRAARRSGILYGQVFPAASSTFRMFESGMVPPRPR